MTKILNIKDFMEKFGETEMSFSGYHKFSFSYIGETDEGVTVYCSIGGNASDVYELRVVAAETIKLSELSPSSAFAEKDNELIFDTYKF